VADVGSLFYAFGIKSITTALSASVVNCVIVVITLTACRAVFTVARLASVYATTRSFERNSLKW
jgi:3-deoxy-D-arabino-heptulosonate 7-phosphate (DAHP) synthase class II